MDESKDIIISDAAKEAAIKALEKRGTPNSLIRLGIKGGGCSGYSYVIKFEDNIPNEKDIVFEFDKLKIVIDPKSLKYLNGMKLEWENTLMNKGFKFVNPNEKSRCGCGNSFQV